MKKILAMVLFTIFVLPLKMTNAIIDEQLSIGYAPFAVAHPKFDCSDFINSIKHEKVLNIVWLYNTFGTNYKCLNKIIDDPRLNYLETHLLNGPGHRNRRLESREFLKQYSTSQWNSVLLRNNKVAKKKFMRYVRGLQKILNRKRETTTCLISPELESNISSKAAKTLIAWSREAFPQCLIVWNPIKKTTNKNTADFVEQHGRNPIAKSPCVINLDGGDINFEDRISQQKKYYRSGLKNWIEAADLKKYIRKYSATCSVVFIWVPEYNCIDTTKSPSSFIPPTKRLCNQTKVFKLIQNEVKKF